MLHRSALHVLAVAVILAALPARGEERKVRVSNTTPNCRDAREQRNEICAPVGKRIKSFGIRDVSNRQGTILSQGPDPQRPNCLIIVTRVVPSGEDCILNICNCKGRGWIEL